VRKAVVVVRDYNEDGPSGRADLMNSILTKGVIRNGQVEVAEPIDLPDGSEVTIISDADATLAGVSDDDRPMTPSEIVATLAAMEKIEPFDMTDEERRNADAWEKKVNDYTIANMDRDTHERTT
jgi:hypothetical protein